MSLKGVICSADAKRSDCNANEQEATLKAKHRLQNVCAVLQTIF